MTTLTLACRTAGITPYAVAHWETDDVQRFDDLTSAMGLLEQWAGAATTGPGRR